MTLREEIARRLGYVYRKTHGWSQPEVHWGDREDPDLMGEAVENMRRSENAERLTWLAVADECIRQMEWARRECWPVQKVESMKIDQSKYPGMSGVRTVGENPLTAAPEGWKP